MTTEQNTPAIRTPKSFIGRHVETTLVRQEFTYRNGDTINYDAYLLNDEDFVNEVNEAWPDNRIWLHGSLGTSDFKENRFNIQINQDGFVVGEWLG